MLQILLNYPSSHVRLVLRLYFNVILPLLGVVGDQCCKKRAQLKLLQGARLDVTQTTGWLRGVSAAYMVYALRRSPAGWLGIVMIMSSVLWLVADLVTSGFVVTVNVVDRCRFNTSSYVAVGFNDRGNIGPFTVGSIGLPWQIITRAVETSRSNGGLSGIFHKVNTDPSFRADKQDIIGSWHCLQIGSDSVYAAREYVETIVEDLVSRDLLYTYNSTCRTQFIGLNWYVQMAAWSSSVGDWSSQLTGETPDQIINSTISEQWDVRAAIDLSPNPEDPKVMRSFQCSMDTSALDYVRGKLQAYTTTTNFCNDMRSNIYHYLGTNVTVIDDPGPAIARTLNNIFMMAAAYNSGRNDPPPHIADPYQGCIAPRTSVPAGVMATFLFVTLITVIVSLYWVFLLLKVTRLKHRQSESNSHYHHHHHHQANPNSIIDLVPNGLLDWILHAVRATSTPELDLGYKTLKQWTLTPSQDGTAAALQLTHRAERTPVFSGADPGIAMTPLLAASGWKVGLEVQEAGEGLGLMKRPSVASYRADSSVSELSSFSRDLRYH